MSLDPAIAHLNACWTWFNYPRVTASGTAAYYSGISASGVESFCKWDYSGTLLTYGPPSSATTLAADDHSNPAMLVLADGTVLTAYSEHNGNSWAAKTTGAGQLNSWGAQTAVSTGNSDAYALLWQAGDTAKTVYWYFRRGLQDRLFRTSTNGGATWVEFGTSVIANGTNRPYMLICPNGSTRLDFFVSSGQPDEVTNSLYHFYMTVASNGTRSYFKSDGTSIGGDAALPLTPGTTNMTLVWDGATRNSWNWDIQIIAGNPVVTFATYTTTTLTNDTHHYHQARWDGAAWTSEEITQGGAAATTPHWLYTAQPEYSGGVCQDPNDINVVYASLKYGAADWRVEQWTHTGTFGSGSWSKTADTSGNTSTVNARPICPSGISPTKVMWFEGTYTTFTSYATRLRASPSFAWRLAKAASPSYQSTKAPTGVQAYYLLTEGSGAPADLVHAYTTTLVGSPTWNAAAGGDFGPYLSGFLTTAYVNIDAMAAAMSTAIAAVGYPFWMAVLYRNTSATAGYSIGLGRAADTVPFWGTTHNDGSVSNVIGNIWRDNAGTNSVDTATISASTAAGYHVLVVSKASTTSQTFVLDGVNRTNASTTTGATSFDRGGMGVLRRSTIALAFPGQIHAALMGWGALPDDTSLCLDLLNGNFAGTFGGGSSSSLVSSSAPSSISASVSPTAIISSIGPSASLQPSARSSLAPSSLIVSSSVAPSAVPSLPSISPSSSLSPSNRPSFSSVILASSISPAAASSLLVPSVSPSIGPSASLQPSSSIFVASSLISPAVASSLSVPSISSSPQPSVSPRPSSSISALSVSPGFSSVIPSSSRVPQPGVGAIILDVIMFQRTIVDEVYVPR